MKPNTIEIITYGDQIIIEETGEIINLEPRDEDGNPEICKEWKEQAIKDSNDIKGLDNLVREKSPYPTGDGVLEWRCRTTKKFQLEWYPIMDENYITKNRLWDSDWLCRKYPDRFKGFYERWELGDDIYDKALDPENTIQHEQLPKWIIREEMYPNSDT